jgi:hypothetical protein
MPVFCTTHTRRAIGANFAGANELMVLADKKDTFAGRTL